MPSDIAGGIFFVPKRSPGPPAESKINIVLTLNEEEREDKLKILHSRRQSGFSGSEACSPNMQEV